MPPWYSPVKPKPVYENSEVQVFWDVPVYADYQQVRANRVDARIINHKSKQVLTREMSFHGLIIVHGKTKRKP